ncbi:MULTISPECIES: hypothetical protein [Halorussus]|uniref:hypothetical protein n=1 Tax=Halorussus TaxID=1070314 RepID=UPI00209FFAD5|nr:hypothetical protein [Halorussus vallis]USZ75211.1 hypothetical protein NGM07_17470 [Halorussus vallis]
MKTLGDLVARERRGGDPAVVAPRTGRSYDYRRFCTTAWKTGNFFRRLGVHANDEVASADSAGERSEASSHDAAVAVAADPEPEALLALFGAALLGAPTRFVPRRGGAGRTGSEASVEARVVVAPSESVSDYNLAAGGQRVGYGDPPDDPATHHFERDVWSENPAFPETPVPPATSALVAGGRAFSHADLLGAARGVAETWDLEPGDEVAVRAPLTEPGAVVAGVLAPLLAGAAVLLPTDESVGDCAVVDGSGADAPEDRTLPAAALEL